MNPLRLQIASIIAIAGQIPGMDKEVTKYSEALDIGTGRVVGGDSNNGRPIRKNAVPKRNELCDCGSGKKFKKCCL